MRRLTFVGFVVVAFAVGIFVGHKRAAHASQAGTPAVAQVVAAPDQALAADTDAEPYAKKCSFNSDCPYGKCKGGACGACDFNSDCKGWGKCKSGSCGACDFNSDCKGFGDCKGGRCTKSPY